MKTLRILAALGLLQAALLMATQSAKDLETAQRHYTEGRFKEAADIYSALTVVSPKLAEAHTGLIRARLALDQVRDAALAARDALKALPDSAATAAAAGDMEYRIGQIREALVFYQRALQLDPNFGRAWWGIGRVEMISSMRKSARDHFIKAYTLAPDDPDVVLDWAWAAESPEKIAVGLEEYLKLAPLQMGSKLSAARNQIAIQKHLGQRQECSLASAPAKDLLKLRSTSPSAIGARRWPSYRVSASINGKGGSFRPGVGRGIRLSPAYASNARITKISTNTTGESSRNYAGIADRVKIGNLEFQNCPVQVSEFVRDGAPGSLDGVFGVGLLSDFLVTLDFEKDELRLESLPARRPGEWTDRDASVNRNDFTPALRIGDQLAIPVRINASQPLLFTINPESNTSVVASEVAEQILTLRSPFGTDVPDRGTCSINCVSFGLANQQIRAELLPVNLALANYEAGFQFEGTIGTNVLNQFVVTMDFRNGFVKFDKFR